MLGDKEIFKKKYNKDKDIPSKEAKKINDAYDKLMDRFRKEIEEDDEYALPKERENDAPWEEEAPSPWHDIGYKIPSTGETVFYTSEAPKKYMSKPMVEMCKTGGFNSKKEVEKFLKMHIASPEDVQKIMTDSSFAQKLDELHHHAMQQAQLKAHRTLHKEYMEGFQGAEQLGSVIAGIGHRMDCKPAVLFGKSMVIAMQFSQGLEKATQCFSGAVLPSMGFMQALGPTALILSASFSLMEMFFGDDGQSLAQAQAEQLHKVYTALSQQIFELKEDIHQVLGAVHQVGQMVQQLSRQQQQLFELQKATVDLIGQCFHMMGIQLKNASAHTQYALERLRIDIQYLIEVGVSRELRDYKAKINKKVKAIEAIDKQGSSDAKYLLLTQLMSELNSQRQEVCSAWWSGREEFTLNTDNALLYSRFMARRIRTEDYALGFLAEHFEKVMGVSLSSLNINKNQLFANSLWYFTAKEYLKLSLNLPSLQNNPCADELSDIEQQAENAIRFIHLIHSHDALFKNLLEKHESILQNLQFMLCNYYTLTKAQSLVPSIASEAASPDGSAPTGSNSPEHTEPVIFNNYFQADILENIKQMLYDLDKNHLLLRMFAFVGGLTIQRRQFIDNLTNSEKILSQAIYPYELAPTKLALTDVSTMLKNYIDKDHSGNKDMRVYQTGCNMIGAQKMDDAIVYFNASSTADREQNYSPTRLMLSFIQTNDSQGAIKSVAHYQDNKNPQMPVVARPPIPIDYHNLSFYGDCDLSDMWASSHVYTGVDGVPMYVLYTGGSGQFAMRHIPADLPAHANEAAQWVNCNNTGGPTPFSTKLALRSPHDSRKQHFVQESRYAVQTLKTKQHVIVLHSDWKAMQEVNVYIVSFANTNRHDNLVIKGRAIVLVEEIMGGVWVHYKDNTTNQTLSFVCSLALNAKIKAKLNSSHLPDRWDFNIQLKREESVVANEIYNLILEEVQAKNGYTHFDVVSTEYHLFDLHARQYIKNNQFSTYAWIAPSCLVQPNHRFSTVFSNSDGGFLLHGAVSILNNQMHTVMLQHSYQETNTSPCTMSSFSYKRTLAYDYPIAAQSIQQVKMIPIGGKVLSQYWSDGAKECILVISYKDRESKPRLACLSYSTYSFQSGFIPRLNHCDFSLPKEVHPIADCQAMRVFSVSLAGEDHLIINLLSKDYAVLVFCFNPKTKKLIQLANGPKVHIPPDNEYYDIAHLRATGFCPFNNFAATCKELRYPDNTLVPTIYFAFTRIENGVNTLYTIPYKITPALKAHFHIMKDWQPLKPDTLATPAGPTAVASHLPATNTNLSVNPPKAVANEPTVPHSKLSAQLKKIQLLITQKRNLQSIHDTAQDAAQGAAPPRTSEEQDGFCSDFIEQVEAIKSKSKKNHMILKNYLELLIQRLSAQSSQSSQSNHSNHSNHLNQSILEQIVADIGVLDTQLPILNQLELIPANLNMLLTTLKKIADAFDALDVMLKSFLDALYPIGNNINRMIEEINAFIKTTQPKENAGYFPSRRGFKGTRGPREAAASERKMSEGKMEDIKVPDTVKQARNTG